jgi:hypothetical protein
MVAPVLWLVASSPSSFALIVRQLRLHGRTKTDERVWLRMAQPDTPEHVVRAWVDLRAAERSGLPWPRRRTGP